MDPKSTRFFEEAASLGEALIRVEGDSQPHFPESARGLVTGLLMWVRLRDGDQAQLATVRDLLTEAEETDAAGRPIKGLRATAARMVASGNFQIASLAGRFLKENRELDSIRSTADTQTRWLLSEPMRADLAKNGIDFGQLKDRPTTVFVILPAEDLEFHYVWLRIIITCALNALYRRGGDDGVPTLFMLSEFAQLGHLKPITAALGQGRKYGVRLWPVLQNFGQLRTLYGPDGASTFLSNSGATFAFTPNDGDTAELMSKRSGEVSELGLSASDDPNGPARVNYQERRRRLFPPDEMFNLPPFHGLVWFHGQSRPVPVYMPPYWKIRACRRLARPDPYHRPAAGGGKLRRAIKATGIAAVLGAAAVIAGLWLLGPNHPAPASAGPAGPPAALREAAPPPGSKPPAAAPRARPHATRQQ